MPKLKTGAALAGSYVDDRRDGVWRSWPRPGVLQLEATWRADRLDGPWRELFPDGTVAVEGQHRAGHRVGVWRWSDRRGQTTRRRDYGLLGGE